jgi:metal-responsive CopG/Arc/MetJ family transcriptional regulator
MLKHSIKISKELMARVKKCSEAAGYSSPDEFIEHVLERELAKTEEAESNEEIIRKLKGLGYLE